MAESVPVINYPTIIRYQPLMEGEHCFYYGVEGEHLYNVIKNALKNKDRLKQMEKRRENIACNIIPVRKFFSIL
ncbi:MAG: hypothetical protein WAU61_05770 [Smithella sp.]